MSVWEEEFARDYERPRVNRVTVGFSGIDPPPKVGREDLASALQEYFTSLNIGIDGGEIT